MTNLHWELIGSIAIDSGTVWLGDPCYVIGHDAAFAPQTWQAFCDCIPSAHDEQGYSEPLGETIGVATHTGYGDGMYPVYVRKIDGRIASVRIDFIDNSQ